MDGPASLAIGLTGLRVSPHFDRPWMATTVAAFWSKRWDLAAGGLAAREAEASAHAAAGAPTKPCSTGNCLVRPNLPSNPVPWCCCPPSAGNTLRQLIFDSVCEGRLWALPQGSPHRQPSPARKLLGSIAAFAASGLIHECIFW